MFGAQAIITAKAIIPLLVETGSRLTVYFYDRMFAHNPEFKETFNMSNQCNGDQREALLSATAAYASNIENLPVLLSTTEKTVQKHTSFQIKPEQYGIVGEHLLVTLDGILNPGQEVLDTWGKACGVLANVFINHEAEAYSENASKANGWEGTRDLRVMAKTPCSAFITSLKLEPAGGGAVAEYRPGRYLDVWPRPRDFPHQEIRQYSLTRKPDGKDCRIAVKREEGGQISSWLHNHVNVNDVIKLVAPAGDFFMVVVDGTPMTLVPAGVGQTPMLAMLGTLAKAGHAAQVDWFHAVENGDVHAFTGEAKELGQSLPRFAAYTWCRQPSGTDRAKDQFDSEGLMDLSKQEGAFSDPTMQFHFCGPVGFMQLAARQLVDLGVKQENIHYECFGPHKML